MNKYLVISLLIHTVSFVLITFNFNFKEKKEEKQQQKQNGMFSVEIITPKDSNSDSSVPIKKPKNFFWGLGISVNPEVRTILGVDFFGYEITKVYEGYCAEDAGILVGDYVYLINNEILGTDNDIKGEKPKKLRLTIERNRIIININTERCKIYY